MGHGRSLLGMFVLFRYVHGCQRQRDGDDILQKFNRVLAGSFLPNLLSNVPIIIILPLFPCDASDENHGRNP